MISLSSGGGGRKATGLGFESRRVDEIDCKDDPTVDPDVSLSYIDEKIRNVLGHFQKYFEGGVSVESLGSQFGGYGSFLSVRKRPSSPSHRISSYVTQKSPIEFSSSGNSQIKKIPCFFEDHCTAPQSGLPLDTAPLPMSEDLMGGGGDKMDKTKYSSWCQDEDLTEHHTEIKPAEKTLMKFKIKLGSDRRTNSEIYSGLGLDASLSPSMDNTLEKGLEISPETHDAPNASPNSIIQMMTTFPVPEEQLLSPLPDCLRRLTAKEDLQVGPTSKGHASVKNNSISLKSGGILNRCKINCENREEKPHVNGAEENSGGVEEYIVPLKGEKGMYKGTPVKREASRPSTNDKKAGQMVTTNEESRSVGNACAGKKVNSVNDNIKNLLKDGSLQGGKATDFDNLKGVKDLKAKALDPQKNKKTVIDCAPKERSDAKNYRKGLPSNGGKRNSRGGDKYINSDSDFPNFKTKSSSLESRKRTRVDDGYLTTTDMEDPERGLALGNAAERNRGLFRESELEYANIGIGEGSKMAVDNIDKASMSEAGSVELCAKIASPRKGSGCDPDPSHEHVSPAIIKENWVCCDTCQAWRLLPVSTIPESLPEKWSCSMLDWLPGMNNCSFSEEETTSAVIFSYHVAAPEGQSATVDGGEAKIQVSNVGDDSQFSKTVKNTHTAGKRRSLSAIKESSPVRDFEPCDEPHGKKPSFLHGGEGNMKVKNIREARCYNAKVDADGVSSSGKEKTMKKAGSDSRKDFSSAATGKRGTERGGDPPPKDPKPKTIHGREIPLTKSKRKLLLEIDDPSAECDDDKGSGHLSETTAIMLRKNEQGKVKKAKLWNTEESETIMKEDMGRGDLKDPNLVSDIGHGSVQKEEGVGKDLGSLPNSVVTITSSSCKVNEPQKTKSNLQNCITSPMESVSSLPLPEVSNPSRPLIARGNLIGKGVIQKGFGLENGDVREGNTTENATSKRVSSPSPHAVKDSEPITRSECIVINSRDLKPRAEKNRAGYNSDKREGKVVIKPYNSNVKPNYEGSGNPGVKISQKTVPGLPPDGRKKEAVYEPQRVSEDGNNQNGKRQKITVQGSPGGIIDCGKSGRRAPPSLDLNTALKEAKSLKHMADRLKSSGSVSVDSTCLYFEAALKFLHLAYLLETCGSGSGNGRKNGEMESLQMYRSTAQLFQFCAHEYERSKKMASAAVSLKCVEVAFMRVAYGSHAAVNTDRHELNMGLRGQSPSSSASEIDNVNNPPTAARLPTPAKGGGVLSPRPGGDHAMAGKSRHNLDRLLVFTSDVNSGMEASRRSQAAAFAAAAEIREESMVIVRKVLDFGFHDVEALLRLTRLAMDSL